MKHYLVDTKSLGNVTVAIIKESKIMDRAVVEQVSAELDDIIEMEPGCRLIENIKVSPVFGPR